MPADTDNKRLSARPVTAAFLAPADASLSAAFRHALGGSPLQGHLPDQPLKRGQEMAKLAKAGKPHAPGKGASRKPHIGPRSGHK